MEQIKTGELLEGDDRRFPLADYFDFDIRPYLSIVTFESDETILQEGRQPAFLLYLISGRAKLFISHKNGRISLINFLNAPCFIGEMELIGAQNAANGITAITPCTCYAIPKGVCQEELLHDVKFLRALCLFLGQKALGNTDNYAKNQSYPLEVRLAKFILMTAQNNLYREKHTEVAEYLGVTYRHLLYVLADFVKRGFLLKTKQGYRIQQADALQKLSGL